MKDPIESAKDLLSATGNVIKAPINIIVETVKGDPEEGVDMAIDNISDAIDDVGDAVFGFFD